MMLRFVPFADLHYGIKIVRAAQLQRVCEQHCAQQASRRAWAERRLPLAEWALQQWQARMRRTQTRARELVALRTESERLAQEQARLRDKIAQVDAVLTVLWQREQVTDSSVNLQERRARVEAHRARLLHRRARLYERQARVQSQWVPPAHIEIAVALMQGCLDTAQRRVERMRALVGA